MTTSQFNPTPLPRKSLGDKIVNAMTVDVEDYFQVQALVSAYERSGWEAQELRVEANTERLLDLFAEKDAKATFFTLGWIAERIPATIRRIVEEGHELASHGYEHVRIFEQTRDVFQEDIRKTRQTLEDISGAQVKGYRAATFSMREDVLWAYEALVAEGYTYSSSVYPVKHDLYGMDRAPRFAFRPVSDLPIVEYPMPTRKAFGRLWPGGGGGYFRIFPYTLARSSIRAINQKDGQPFMFYLHPWEIDAEQPRPASVPVKSRLRHYTNLSRMEGKLSRLLDEFSWGRVDQCFTNEIAQLALEAAQ